MGALDDFEAEGGLDAFEREEKKPRSQLAEMFGDRIRQARNGPVGMAQAAPRDKIETAARSAAKTATLGFADEIAGGVGAMAGAIADLQQGKDPSARGSFADVYRAERDAYALEDEANELANPATDFVTSIPAALATAPLAAGRAAKGLAAIGQAAKGGAIVGGIAGFGNSTADLTRGEAVDALDDSAGGALLGGTLGAGLSGLGTGIQRLFQPAEVRAAEALGGKAGGLGNPVAQDVAAANAVTGQQPSIASMGGSSERAANSLRRLFAKDADANIIAQNAERGAEKAAMDLRATELNPAIEARLRDGMARQRDLAQGAVAEARQGVGAATEEALNRRAASNLNSQRLASERASARLREELLTGKEITRSRGDNPREVIPGAAESMKGTPKSPLINEAKERLAQSKEMAKGVANKNRDSKELLKPDSVANERAKMAGKTDVLAANRSRLMEKEVPGKFSQQAKDQLQRDGDPAAKELLEFDRLVGLNKSGRAAVDKSRPDIMEQLGIAGKVGKIGATGGIMAPVELRRFMNDRALAKVAKNPKLVREVIDMLADGFDRKTMSSELRAVLAAEGANLQED